MAKKTTKKALAPKRKSAIAVDLQTGLVTQVALRDVHPDPDQPRKVFDEKSLAVLAANIKARGIYQPILARYVDGKVTIIDGERRWRAAKIAGLKAVPVLLQDTGTYDAEALQADQVGLNQLGERLRPMEIARQLRKWRDAGKTPNEIAKLLADMGHEPMKPAAIAELAGLTDLPDWAQRMIDREELAAGPAALVVDAVAIPGVEKPLRKALEQDIGYRGTLTARDVKGRVSDALRSIGVNLDRTESWYGSEAVHFAWKERCRNCEHLVKWDGSGYCINRKQFEVHNQEAKDAGLLPGGKRPDPKLRDERGRITTPEKIEEQKAELREKSLTEKARDYLHAHLVEFIRNGLRYEASEPKFEAALILWAALKKPGEIGRSGSPGVWYGTRRGDSAAATMKVAGLEQVLEEGDPGLIAREAALEILSELEWRETQVLARHLFGPDIATVWRANEAFFDLFRKSELAHLATVHGCELPEGRRSWDALKAGDLKAALLAQRDKLQRPAILADLYGGDIDEPFVPYSQRGRGDDSEEREAVCIGCGCTYSDPCDGGCGWATDIEVGDGGLLVAVCDSEGCASHIERFENDDLTLSPVALAKVEAREPLAADDDEDEDDDQGEDLEDAA